MSFLYDQAGKRKYLTIDERRAFLDAASALNPEVYTFCLTLAYTGARISEVLALTPDRIDYSEKLLIFECLKKRRRGIYRSVPVPQKLLVSLKKVHQITLAHRNQDTKYERIWPWCRTTAWKHVKRTMVIAGIVGVHASPKGLRHSFGVCSLQSHAPINMVRKWLGHSRIATTAIYADAIGSEERNLAKRFWRTFE